MAVGILKIRKSRKSERIIIFLCGDLGILAVIVHVLHEYIIDHTHGQHVEVTEGQAYL